MAACRSWVATTKRCANCAEPFQCAFSCCWCDEIRLDDAARDALRQRFGDCLCRACLTAFAKEGSCPPSVPAQR